MADEQRATRIIVPAPPMGGKSFLLKEKGLFVLEVGPGTLRTIACTHAGAGALEVIDGVPDASGFFPGDELKQPQQPDGMAERMAARQALRERHRGVQPAENDEDATAWRETEPTPEDLAYAKDPFWSRNGRPLYGAPAMVMGSWMMDGGFLHGLTIRAEAGHESTSAMATIVWAAFRQRGG